MNLVDLSVLRAELGNLRAELLDAVRSRVEMALGSLFLKTRLGATTEGRRKQQSGDRNPLVHLTESFTNPENESAPRQDEAEAIELPAFACVPLDGDPAWAINLGPKTVVIPTASERYRPQDLGRGDAAVYALCKQQPVAYLRTDGTLELRSGGQVQGTVRLNPDGSIEVKGSTVKVQGTGEVQIQGKDVVVNGGTLRVARVTDPVPATNDFLLWAAAVRTAITQLANGLVAVPPPQVPTTIGAVDGGAAEFKA